MRWLLLVNLLLLSACSFIRNSPPEATLAELQPVAMPASRSEIPSVSLAELADVYREVLLVTDDPATRVGVVERLADIEMLQAEATLADSGPRPDLFAEAILAYRGLLAANPDSPGNDRLLYQLSKAYDMTGDTEQALVALEALGNEYPASAHYTEAQFRMAESYFSAGRYAAAERAYQQVIEAGEDSPYFLNALYMDGWSRFKLGAYRESIRPYSETLDRLLPPDNDINSLSAADQALVRDCLRVLAVVFSYLEGVDTIAMAYQQLGERSYQPLLYQELGELYLKQERFRDSAETFRDFSRRHPDSEYAHRFHVRVIGIYERAGFRDLIVQEKQDYVANYPVTGNYYIASAETVQGEIADNLMLYIEELATHFHALAQATEDAEATAGFQLAGNYYQLYIDSFPGDSRVPEFGFLLAEARLASAEHAEAVSVFEWVAYDFPDYQRAADAGYAAIVSYQFLIDGAPEEQQATIAKSRAYSQLRFASRFPADERSPAVLNNAASSLLELGEYPLAIIAAAGLVNWQPAPPGALLAPAWLVISHSYFELEDYQEAGDGYRRSLVAMSDRDPLRAATVERLAASLYRQAEITAVTGDALAAAQQFALVVQETPGAGFRRQAQFDAAYYYMEAGEYEQANRLLLDFRTRFAGDPLAEDVPLRLVHNYEQLELWELAAQELDSLLPRESDEQRAREMLYLTAEYYDRAANLELAIDRFRSYAHTWEQPLAPRLEAMNRLSEIYDELDEQRKRRFWLNKIVDADAATDAPSERSRYLAARASSVFAGDYLAEFEAIKLRHPIKASLKKKNRAMKKALQAWQKTNSYGVAEFASLATYRMGQIYQSLSADLLASERPGGLDDLALEQYELLLEEQAYPFEEKAIAIHETNMQRSWEGWYDSWIKQSFAALASLSPGRYAKTEAAPGYSELIY